ncbi:putative gamma-glutamyl hydrolase 3 [Vitis vinifera]|uniref:Putative gamma-glutamyl hydrolase 3 n=1 Tax=Vitis vinifera TaxID=29760 RepID=A0A438E5V5_VITVI|nr:putative gamma-glutamyl hydrolase 3 [Vitis vinifera]
MSILSISTTTNTIAITNEQLLLSPPPCRLISSLALSSASTSSTASPADSSDMPKDAVSASSSSGRYSEIWNYLWVPLLLSVSKELTAAKAESTILLPSDVRLGSARSSPSCPAPDPKLNFRPVVGILTHPGDGASGRLNNDTNASYIAASYVKFVESAGARVIPLIYNEPLRFSTRLVPHHLWHLPSILENLSIPFSPHNPQQNETRDLPNNLASSRVPKVLERNNHHVVNCLAEPTPSSLYTFFTYNPLLCSILIVFLQKLNLVNGVIFTGGWAKSGLYYTTVGEIFKKSLEKNDVGDHFPVLAICLGFELLTMIISKDIKILEEFSAADQASTLNFMKNTDIRGTVFQRYKFVCVSSRFTEKLSTDCLVMQNHHGDDVFWIVCNLNIFFVKIQASEVDFPLQQYGISPERFQENTDLSSFFKILTTSTDEDDKVYVSTAQAHSYPVTAFPMASRGRCCLAFAFC